MVQCHCFERRPDNYENKTATYTFLQSGRNDNHVGNVTWTADDIDYFVPMTWFFFEWRNFTILLLVVLCHHCNTHFQSVAQWPKNVTQRKHAGVWVWFSDFSIIGKSLNFGLLSPIAQPWPKLWGKGKKTTINFSVFGFIVFPMAILCRTKKALGGADKLGTASGKAVSQKRSWSTGSNADLHPLRMGYNSQCGCWLALGPSQMSLIQKQGPKPSS